MTSGFPETEQQLAGLKITCYAEVYVESDSSAYLKVFKYINLLDTEILAHVFTPGGGGALGYFLGGYVPPGTPNWHAVQEKIPLKLIPRSKIGPIFYTPF